jgi:hypothetical protein
MMKQKLWMIALLLVFVMGCQLTSPTPTSTPEITGLPAKPTNTPAQPPTQAAVQVATGVAEPVDFVVSSWAELAFRPLSVYQEQAYDQAIGKLPITLKNTLNPKVIEGLSAEQLSFLAKNGFVVIDSGEEQFKDIRQNIAIVNGQPYFLTTDAAYHALHVTFNDLLEALEKDALNPVMVRLLQALYDQVGKYAKQSGGTSVEADTVLARNYLAVAIKLFDPQIALDPDAETAIAAQLAQISAEAGKDESALLPGFIDDYGSYRPVGHYAGNPQLEAYFRGMTWLGRVAFHFQNLENADLVPSRAPLIITLALREAKVDGQAAYQVWASVYAMLDFIIGPSDDPGPLELNTLMESVYGDRFSLAALQDDTLWQTFLGRVNELPAPQINSTFQNTSLAMSVERDWRLMGQRFTLDGMIFQQMISDKVTERFFPSGLDVAAAFGSQPALTALEQAGETRYANYTAQMTAMQDAVNALPEEFWTNRFYSAWQYAFRAQLPQKDAAFPPFMQTKAWGYKDVNSVLGSWAELKHDTVLYAKMPEGLGGGGPPTSGPAPSYVEPAPDVFYRLAFATQVLYDGLSFYVMDWQNRDWMRTSSDGTPGIYEYVQFLSRLNENLQAFGEIAERELKGEALSESDNYRIQSCLEFKECLDRGMYSENEMDPDPIPVIAAVSGYENEILEAGVGKLNRIYVVVPLGDQLQIAQGGVFTYYEFRQPRSDRLTDEAWRAMLESDPPQTPAWYTNFVVPGGSVRDVLAFRIGDVYYLTEEGGTPPLNMRAEPSKNASVVDQLGVDTYLEIIEGPVTNSSGTWWKVRNLFGEREGWVLENAAWYARSY